MEDPIKMDDFGGKPPIIGNTHSLPGCKESSSRKQGKKSGRGGIFPSFLKGTGKLLMYYKWAVWSMEQHHNFSVQVI